MRRFSRVSSSTDATLCFITSGYLMERVEWPLATAGLMTDRLATAYLKVESLHRASFVSLSVAHVENDNICSVACDHSSQLSATGLGPLAAAVPTWATPFCYTSCEALFYRIMVYR